jgi:hypothetical protein
MKIKRSEKQKKLERLYVSDHVEKVSVFAWLPVLVEDHYVWLERITVERTVYYRVSSRSIKFFWVYGI